MHSKEGAKDPNDEGSLNPQKRRLEQLRKRRELEAAALLAEKQPPVKKRSKTLSKEVTPKSSREAVKVSAEAVECEYSADEDDDYEDEEIRGTKNEMLKKLMIDNKKLDKALKLAAENEKKLNTMQEVSSKWFDKYETMLDELDQQLTSYDTSQKMIVGNIIGNVKPLCERWKESRKAMTAMKFAGMGMPSTTFVGTLLHYAITIIRQLLFAMAYCRDLISTSSPTNSVRFPNSPVPQ